jgi:hypothetical protein
VNTVRAEAGSMGASCSAPWPNGNRTLTLLCHCCSCTHHPARHNLAT